jgi:large subunit ribosomal protein L25
MGEGDIVLQLQERKVLGKAVKQLRRDGLVPAVIHDHGKESVPVVASYLEAVHTFQEAGKHHPVNLQLGSQKYLTIIKDADFDPKKRQLRHIVFSAIRQDETVETEVPVVFAQDVEIPAEKASLMVLKQLDHVKVEALPHNLPDELVIDPSVLAEVGDKLTVADLHVPAGVVILTEPETQIAVVEVPKDQLAEAEAIAEQAETAAAAGEGEEPAEAPAEGEATPAAEGETPKEPSEEG